MRTNALIVALTILLLASQSKAQPAIEWIHTFGNQDREMFNDVYGRADGGYLMCGWKAVRIGNQQWDYYFYIVAASANANQEWQAVLGDGEQHVHMEATTIIELDGGDCAVGGTRGTGPRDSPQAFVARISPEGRVRWQRLYAQGTSCAALIELKEGDLMLAGAAHNDNMGNSAWSGMLIRINPDNGDIRWRENYDVLGHKTSFSSMRETEDGVVVAGRILRDDMQQSRILSAKYRTGDGSGIWLRSYDSVFPFDYDATLCSVPGGFAINSNARNINAPYNDTLCLRRINAEGEQEFIVQTDLDESLEDVSKGWYGLARIANNDLIQVGIARYDAGNARPIVQCITAEGQERWHNIYDLPDLGNFENGLNFTVSVAATPDGGAVVCGTVLPSGRNDQFDYDGMLIKIAPLRNEPLVFYRSPEDTILECLIDDGIRFTVRASDQLRRDITYLWVYDEVDTISTDTSVVVTFNEFDEHLVRCQVSNGEFSSSVRWHINVVDLFIAAFTPDTLNLAIRRGASVDFSLDTVRYSDGDAPAYQWTKSNIDNQEQERSGEDARATIPFLQSGNYTVEGLVYRGESSDAVVWNVAVRGVIWSFRPEGLSLSVQVGEQVGFELYPSDQDTGQIAYSWMMNGEAVGTDSTLVCQFNQKGTIIVAGVVTEGAEADTVQWTVNVTPLGVGDKTIGQAGTPILLSAHPNPFNSTTQFRYSLPTAGAVRLVLVDLRGRVIATLVNRRQEAGEHSVTFDGTGIPAGIYFARLEAGASKQTVKMVLVR